MKKDVKLFFFVFLGVFIVFTISLVGSQPQKFNVENSVYKSLEVNGSVGVMIKLKVNSSSERKSVENQIGKNKVSFSIRDIVYAKVSTSDLLNLESNSNIESLTPERTFKLDLQDSVPWINATNAQETVYNGLNLTGVGETVCIIDSGVNYSHPDLGGCYGNNNASSNCTILGGYDFVNNDADPMDDFGHGTHVAGIVASHGGITGVAPGTKIIMLKACNSSGFCSELNLQKSINWCVNNATKFNISVVSLSLGSDTLYTDYCNGDLLASSINSAVAQNISVVAATGNDGNSTGISSPACIQSVIRAGSTTKADAVSSFSNSWSHNLLLAPGSNINSTMLLSPSGEILGQCGTGNPYCVLSGTSMATPHISASIAILNEYLKLNSRVQTPSELFSDLNATGKQINDTRNDYNFSRINVYSALNYIDEESPNVTISSPSNGNASTNITQEFNCNATDLSLSNVTLKIWNSTGNLTYNETKSLTGYSNSSVFSVSNLSYGKYDWNCFVGDSKGNVGSGTSNYSLTLSKYIFSLSPKNNTYTNQNQTFVCNSSYTSSESLSNITFEMHNSTGNLVYNETQNISGTSNSTTFNSNFTNEGNYSWDCFFYTNLSTKVDSGNYSVYYDISNPRVNLTSPENSTTYTGTQTINFRYNATDNINISNCSLLWNGVVSDSNTSLVNGSNLFSKSVSPGTSNWSVNCSDAAGNFNASETRLLRVNSPPVVSSGGGGGGGSSGGSSVTYSPPAPEKKNITEGYGVSLKEGYPETFKLSNNESHLVFATKINESNKSVQIVVESEPINLTLEVGETALLNLTSPDYYDLSITLNSINVGFANLTIKEVRIGKRTFHTFNKTNSTEVSTNKKFDFSSQLIYLLFIVIALVILSLWRFFEHKKAVKKEEEKIRDS